MFETVNYEDSGMKWGSVRITLQDINNPNALIVLQTGFHFYLGKKSYYIPPDDHIDITAASTQFSPALPFTQVCESSSDYDQYGKLRYYVKYANADHLLRKPFIFVEGVDFDYKDYYPTQQNWRYGEFGWDVFVSGGNYPNGFPDNDKKGLPFSVGVKLLQFGSNGSSGVIDQLLALGYDVILVDYARGADYIQKNAYALVKAIQDINYRKSLSGSVEENIIVGASMGGLVVRYALAYMEKNNLPHCTRLYTSFDSPHLGANIPIGLQNALLFFAETNNPECIENLRRLNLEAPKQMLLKHLNTGLIGANEYASNSQCFRNNLVDALTTIGWPENLRKIGVSNGNISGIGNGITSGQELLLWSYFTSALGYTFEASKVDIYAYPGINNYMVFHGVYTDQNAVVKSGEILFSFPFPSYGYRIREIPGGAISITLLTGYTYESVYIPRYQKYYYAPPCSPCDNLDGAPGGMNDAIKSFSDGIADIAKTLSGATPPTLGVSGGLAAFIPAISSLALINPPNFNGNYFYNIQTNVFPTIDNVDPTFSHFEAIKGPEYPFPNESHVYLKDNNWYVNTGNTALPGYQGNTNWLINQMKINAYDITSSIPSSNGSTYNFDRNQHKLGTVTVNSGGILQINGNYLTHWGTSNDVIQPSGTTVTVIMPACSNANITIASGGNLILGDNNTSNNKGILDIQSGSSLNLNNGSSFTIYDNSKLIIESGATLNITGTPTINLVGNNSVIEIQDGGIINIPSGVTFTFTGNGFVRFIGGNGLHNATSGSGSIIIAGSGTGATQTHKILEFASSAAGYQLTFIGTNFQVSGGMISSTCDVTYAMPLAISNVTFNGGNNFCNNNFTAVNSTFNASFNCVSNSFPTNNVNILACTFYAKLTAITCSVNISNSYFNLADNTGAIDLINCSAVLNYSNFIDCNLGLNANYISGDIVCTRCLFYNSDANNTLNKGIYFSGSSTGALRLNMTDVLNMNDIGVDMNGGGVFARCGKINSTNNWANAAFALSNDAVLILDPAIASDLGHMDLSGCAVTVNTTDANNLYINNAYSNLSTKGSSSNALNGNITSSVAQLDADHNYWKWGLTPTRANHYNWFYDANGYFDDVTSHKINGPNYLTTAPNIDVACPDRSSGSGTGGTGGGYGKTGNTHSTKIFERADSVPYQTGQTLKHAVQSVFVDDIDTTQTGMDAQLNLHEQVLKHNFGTYKNQAKPVVDLVYRRMQQTIAMGLKHNLIQQTATSAQINKLINVQDTLLNRTSIYDTINRYILIKDKALAMRLSNRRNTALTLLNQAHSLADSSSKKYIEKWQCFIEKEILLQDSMITIKQFLALVKNCGGTDTTIVYSKQGANTTSTIKENVIAEDINKPIVSLYPNPSFDNLNIAINNLAVETQINIQIIDIVGRIIQTGSYQANDKNPVLNVPLNLTSGTYFIILDGGQIHERKRFVVMK